MYNVLAERYHWTPEQVDALPVDFVLTQTAFINALDTHTKKPTKKPAGRRR